MPAADAGRACCAVLVAVSQLLADDAAHRRARHQPAAGRRAGRDRARRARARVGARRRRRGALRDPALPGANWSRRIDWQGRTLTLRPIRPEDEAQHLRVPGAAGPGGHPHARLLQPAQHRAQRAGAADADRLRARDGLHRHRAAAPAAARRRWAWCARVADPDNVDAEFGIVVRSDLKGGGLGERLMDKLIALPARARHAAAGGHRAARERAHAGPGRAPGVRVRRG
ncbi:MAG: hypothetical protein MZW92_73215 [Comamonadaceae bacterium]|nr:hypothetical protein [Comamonadaceae bacterium]